MATITYKQRLVHLRGLRQARGRLAQPRHLRRRVRRAGRAVRIRQEHRAADAGRAGGHRRGQHRDRRQGHGRGAVEGPRHRDGVPELCAVPDQDRRGEHGLRAQAARGVRRRAPQEGGGGRQAARPERFPGPQAGQAVRWPAPTGGDGPRDRAGAAGVLHGRAAVQPGRQAAGADPHPDRRAAAPAGHHHRLRHPRSGGGHDDGRSGRRAARRQAAAVRFAHRALQQTGQRVRGGLHRLTGDEPDDGADHQRRRAGSARTTRWNSNAIS